MLLYSPDLGSLHLRPRAGAEASEARKAHERVPVSARSVLDVDVF